MVKWSCDFRYLLLVVAVAFIYIQMRLFATQSEYTDRLAAAIESENRCTSQMRLLIDQISMQRGRILDLEEKRKLQDHECRQLRALIEDLQRKGLEKITDKEQVPVAAVVVMACNRADYLEKTVKSILTYQRSVASKYPLFVSQDGEDPDVKSKALSYNQLTYMQHLDYEQVHTERPGELIAYYKIARHYKWALDQLFNKHNFDRVIILEDDMEIAPDFFDYFEAAATILDNDKSIMAVSSWNDNGQKQFVQDPCNLSEIIVALILKMRFTVLIFSLDLAGCCLNLLGMNYLQSGRKHILLVYWVKVCGLKLHVFFMHLFRTFSLTKKITYWDDWLRLKENHIGRQFIRPEVCRTYNFGEHGSSFGQFFKQYLEPIKLNDVKAC
ncbi:hypothetical protein RHSIM_Rhsim11G0198000 [Rhododendron simsii]|uniref:Alpha-1,3-mannosyl-glycoprotein 2-beta-N-acetylglucosaminyltransferase n=1 Tax=Rhododendron simsii TaxID=118357 RepID=A0A834G9Y6_RHOSS|nr:hypothetical protein RHSIM_Rhsim11G0198000 [Rhododendron simsii]